MLGRFPYLDEREVVYIYNGSSAISEVVVDAETTSAAFYHKGTLLGASDIKNVFTSNGGKVLIDTDYIFKNYYAATLSNPNTIEGNIGFKIFFEDGSVDSDVINLSLLFYHACLAEGTQITLADRTTKAIEDITYNDELLVWDFDNARFATAKPLWIMKVHTSPQYNLLKFDNGSELKTIDQHRIFNKDIGKFTYPMTDETPVGTTTFTDAGTETKLISKEVVQERVNYYNIITDYHINLFANGILTSCRLSNLYQIENMKYVKDNRKLIPKEEYPTVPQEYYEGLRLAEQPKEVNRGNDVEHSKDLAGYVQNLINKAQPKV